MQCKRNRRLHIHRVDADRPAQFLGGVLHLPETIGATAIKIHSGIPDTDHRSLPQTYGFDMNTFILSAVHSPVQKIPQYEGKEILVRTYLKITIYLIDYNRLTTYCPREESGSQLIHELVQGYSGKQISSHLIQDFREGCF